MYCDLLTIGTWGQPSASPQDMLTSQMDGLYQLWHFTIYFALSFTDCSIEFQFQTKILRLAASKGIVRTSKLAFFISIFDNFLVRNLQYCTETQRTQTQTISYEFLQQYSTIVHNSEATIHSEFETFLPFVDINQLYGTRHPRLFFDRELLQTRSKE